MYLARAEGPAGFDKTVALKRIHPHMAKEEAFVQMFLDEARIASRISHPNVCNVFDFGEDKGNYYIAMEYLNGEPLSKLLRVVWLQPWQKESPRLAHYAARVIADACEGLHAAHELRDDENELLHVVHRDVSPHNLFVTFNGSVRVVDFGIASARNRLHQTSTGEVKGKFAYMAPEQLRGKQVDRRADVWSLGVVLWEMVTMRRLFRRGTEMETIFAVASDSIPRPSQYRYGISPELEEIIMCALARNPEERFATSRDLGRELTRHLASESDLVGPADLADWMKELFPEGATEKRALLDGAKSGTSPPPPPPAATEAARSSLPMEPSLPKGAHALTHGDSEAASTSQVVRHLPLEDDELGKPKGRRYARWGIAAAAVGVTLGLIAGAYQPLRDMLNKEERLRSTEERPKSTVARSEAETAAPPPATAPLGPEAQEAGNSLAQAAAPVAIPATAAPSPAAPSLPDVTRPTSPEKDEQSASPRKRPTRAAPRRVVVSKPAKPEPSAVTGEGVVNVVTPGGWAYVLENGRRLGQTPARLTLSAGKHVLEIRPFGEPPSKRVAVEIEPDRIERVSIRIGN